jgi:hypothetical protein
MLIGRVCLLMGTGSGVLLHSRARLFPPPLG